MKRGLLALLALALAAPLAASAGGGGGNPNYRPSYLAPSLERAANQTPEASVYVIVQSDTGAPRAQNMLQRYSSNTSTRLGIVDAAAGEIRAGDLPELAQKPGLVITPDQPVVLDLGKDKAPKNGKAKPDKKNDHPGQAQDFSSDELWPAAVGVDQLWPQLAGTGNHPNSNKDQPNTPTIAFVDSGIDATRADFGNRVLAQVNLTSLPGNSPGDGRGHGTLVAGLAAGSAPHHAGAAPTAGIVSLDVMDDQGMARTSDVIAAAQWILQNQQAVQHPGRELLAPLGDPDQLPLGSARQGRREALVLRRGRRGRLRQRRRGQSFGAHGLRSGERPVRDHGRRARPARTPATPTAPTWRRGRPGATPSTASPSPS